MAKNRKHQSAAIRFGPAVKAFLLCLLIGGAGIGFVWQKNQIYQLGQQISKREARLKDLRTQNKKLRDQLGYMNSPPFLEARIKELNLGLVRPQPSQVWYMKEPTPEPNKLERDHQLVSRQATANVAINE
jgi:hypothetical protein